jgi:hypothetical protein
VPHCLRIKCLPTHTSNRYSNENSVQTGPKLFCANAVRSERTTYTRSNSSTRRIHLKGCAVAPIARSRCVFTGFAGRKLTHYRALDFKAQAKHGSLRHRRRPRSKGRDDEGTRAYRATSSGRSRVDGLYGSRDAWFVGITCPVLTVIVTLRFFAQGERVVRSTLHRAIRVGVQTGFRRFRSNERLLPAQFDEHCHVTRRPQRLRVTDRICERGIRRHIHGNRPQLALRRVRVEHHSGALNNRNAGMLTARS